MPSSKGPTDNRREAAKERMAEAIRKGDDATITALIRAANDPRRAALDEYADEQAEVWLQLERNIWPSGPAHGSGSGFYAGFKGRLVSRIRAALAASATDEGPPEHDYLWHSGYAAAMAKADARPAAPVALDAGTYEELLASRDALQDDYNALSDEHDKCPAVPEALDVERLARAVRSMRYGCDKSADGKHGGVCGHPFFNTDNGYAEALAREYAALAVSAPDEGLHPEDCHNQTHIALDDARDEIARLRAARPAVPALDVIASKVTALAHLTPEDWAERRGADPIARTINAVLDIIREAR